MNNHPFYPLAEAYDPALVGGKAAALGSLIRAGFPVPDGFVVSVAAFEEYTARALAPTNGASTNNQAEDVVFRAPLDEEFQKHFVALLRERNLWPIAVRSSCTVEDSELASYAGQFETFLNITNEEMALDAIRKCWASIWSAHARAYAARQRLVSNAGMAVIVQRMIQPQFAGVAFSVDPTAAHHGISYAEWVTGTGESLVSGENLGGRIWLDAEGRALRCDSISDAARPPDEIWARMVQLLKRVVTAQGGEQDIEWAWKDGKLFLLQSRPITKFTPRHEFEPAPWELAGRPQGGWSDNRRQLFDCWDEYNPPAIKPLEIDLFIGAIWQASLDMLDYGTGVPDIEDVTVLLDGVPVQIDPSGNRKAASIRWPRGEARTDLLATMNWGAECIGRLRVSLGDIQAQSSKELLLALNECASVHRSLGVTRLRQMQSWIDGECAAKAVLEPMLSKFDASPELLLEQLLAGVDHETRRMNRDLLNLVKQVKERNEAECGNELNHFIGAYGHFQSDGVPLSEARESLLKQIRTMAENPDLTTPESAASRAQSLASELRSRIPKELIGSFEQALKDLRYWYNVREDTKTRVEIARPFLRELARELGRRFVSGNILQNAEQIWLLRHEEINNIIQPAGQPPSNSVLVRREALVRWKAKHSWLPPGFVTEVCRAEDHFWKGLSGSSGKVSGKVRIVHGPHDFGDVQNGEIVVARSTNPVWTQLFGQIRAIIVENGSRLSHAAVVAREYAIPCVVGLTGITKVLKTGESISVDGDNGEVSRYDKKGT